MSKPTPQDLEPIVDTTVPIVAKAQTIIIEDRESLDTALQVISIASQLTDQIEATFDKHIKAAHLAHKALLGEKNRHLNPLIEADNIIRDKIKEFSIERSDICSETKGLSVSNRETVVVEDIILLVKEIAKGKLPTKLIKPDMKALGDMAKAGFKIPGCIVTKKKVVTIRSGSIARIN